MTNRLREIEALGQAVWIDNINRALLEDGILRAARRRGRHQRRHLQPDDLREGDGALGPLRRGLHARPAATTQDAREIFFRLAFRRHPRRRGRPARRPSSATEGQDGYVSFELPPELAFDAAGSVEAAKRFYARDRQGQRPHQGARARPAGVEAFEELTAAGVSVNVTLLFDVQRYVEIAEAYVSGLQRRADAGEPIDRIASVASFFVSRVDGKVDKELDEQGGPAELKGKAAHRQRADRLRVVRADLLRRALGRAGGQGRQRAAAAVGVDVDEEPRLPRHALRRRADRPGHRQHDARRDDRRRARPRARPRARSTRTSPGAHRLIDAVKAAGIDFDDIVSRQLVDEGVESFAASFDSLIDTIKEKASSLSPAAR